MDMLIVRAFNLYQQMLSPTLCAEWDAIVQKHCYIAGWLDKNKVAIKENQCQDWDTLGECKRLHLLTVCKKDAAERHDMYMSVMVRKPPRLSLEQWYKCIKEMNLLAKMLPCLKIQPDCPAEIKQANVPLSNVALCNLIMRSI
eukprot:12069496-Ditylum_brightwellii.AAC.1